MAETLREQPAEERVFGNAFLLLAGATDESAVERYYRQRREEVVQGNTVWLARALDAERGVAADLISGRKVVATIDYDYETESATVYTTSEGGQFGDTTLCQQVGFDEAVETAEKFASDTTTYQQ